MPSVFFISLMAGSPWGGSEELWYRTALLATQKGWKVGCAVYHWKEKESKMDLLQQAGVVAVAEADAGEEGVRRANFSASPAPVRPAPSPRDSAGAAMP